VVGVTAFTAINVFMTRRHPSLMVVAAFAFTPVNGTLKGLRLQ